MAATATPLQPRVVRELERTTSGELLRRQARALREGDFREALDCKLTMLGRQRDARAGRLDWENDGRP